MKLLQIAYTSEWALAKFFPVVFDKRYSGEWELAGIVGKEKDKAQVKDRIDGEIAKRHSFKAKGHVWRASNLEAEINSCRQLLDRLDELGYYCRDNALPTNGFDAAVIHSLNTTHLDYIEQIVRQGIHALVEKPIVVVTDKNHGADRVQLDKLEEIVTANGDGLVLMDAEHYAAKQASLSLFTNFDDMVSNYGRVKEIRGYTYEKDNPEKPRTRSILSRDNNTGLLLDMGVHLFGLIANVGGYIGMITNAEYDIYPGNGTIPAYDVETAVDVEFIVQGEAFFPNTPGYFSFGKFIDNFTVPPVGTDKGKQDLKQVIITFKRNGQETDVTIDFNKGTVYDSTGFVWSTSCHKQEYGNILSEFAAAIKEDRQPRTSFERSIRNLDVIYRAYDQFPVEDNIVKVYER